jgi:hypothetical protein
MASNLMQIDIVWKEVSCTCEPCSGCNKIIYGKQYQLFTIVGEKEYPGEAMVCASCYEIVSV